jgi:hypothetical protein
MSNNGKKRSVTFYDNLINGDPPLQPFVPSDILMDQRTILAQHTMHSADKGKYKNDAVGKTIHSAIVNSKEAKKKPGGGTQGVEALEREVSEKEEWRGNRGRGSSEKASWGNKNNSQVHECRIDEEMETTGGKSEGVMMRERDETCSDEFAQAQYLMSPEAAEYILD